MVPSAATVNGVPPAETVMSQSGLEFLQAMVAGTVPQPPMAETLGFKLVEAAQGRAVFEGLPEFRLYNPIGSVHGGFAATLLDSALGMIDIQHFVIEAHQRTLGNREQAHRNIEIGQPEGGLGQALEMLDVVFDLLTSTNAPETRDQADGVIGLDHWCYPLRVSRTRCSA